MRKRKVKTDREYEIAIDDDSVGYCSWFCGHMVKRKYTDLFYWISGPYSCGLFDKKLVAKNGPIKRCQECFDSEV